MLKAGAQTAPGSVWTISVPQWQPQASSAPEEDAWLEKAEVFKIDPEARKRVRLDVEAGKWTPLGGEDKR
jgi:hypothetical protein